MVTVRDPRHPLFRRSFVVTWRDIRSAYVAGPGAILRIPVRALEEPMNTAIRTKLDVRALQELVDLWRKL